MFFQWIYWPYTCTSRTDIETCCFKMFAFQFQKSQRRFVAWTVYLQKFENPKNMTAVLFPNCSHMFQIFKAIGLNLPALIPNNFLTQDTWRCRSFNARVYGFIQENGATQMQAMNVSTTCLEKRNDMWGKNTKPPTLLTNQAGAHGPRKKPRLNQVEKSKIKMENKKNINTESRIKQ